MKLVVVYGTDRIEREVEAGYTVTPAEIKELYASVLGFDPDAVKLIHNGAELTDSSIVVTDDTTISIEPKALAKGA